MKKRTKYVPYGIINCWPIVKISLVKLFNFLISFTETPNSLDIFHKLSPDFTIYVLSVDDGINNFWPMLNISDVKLFIVFSSSTVVLNRLAILYKLSPLWTV